MDGEILDYPMFKVVGLTLDERYREIQKKGLIKVKLPFGEPCWLATRYADVRTVYGDRRMSRKLGLTHDAPGMFSSKHIKDPGLLLNRDPPEHTRTRRLAAGAFTPQRIEQLQSDIQNFIDTLLDEMAAAGRPADFVSSFSSKLPVRVLAAILGIPQDIAFEFKKWVDISSSLEVTPEGRDEARVRNLAFIKELIAERRTKPSKDLLSELVEARDQGDRLTEDELVTLAGNLWNGGFKTTAWQLGATVFTLMTHRAHWQELLDDPKVMPAAIEELFRWIPSFKHGVPFARWASEDMAYSDGTLVRAGEPVLGEFAVANRDESVYPNADALDFHRVDPAPHLAFVYGPHMCMGHHLARIQIRLTVETLLRRYPKLDLAIPADQVQWSTSSFMRSVDALPLKLQ